MNKVDHATVNECIIITPRGQASREVLEDAPTNDTTSTKNSSSTSPPLDASASPCTPTLTTSEEEETIAMQSTSSIPCTPPSPTQACSNYEEEERGEDGQLGGWVSAIPDYVTDNMVCDFSMVAMPVEMPAANFYMGAAEDFWGGFMDGACWLNDAMDATRLSQDSMSGYAGTDEEVYEAGDPAAHVAAVDRLLAALLEGVKPRKKGVALRAPQQQTSQGNRSMEMAAVAVPRVQKRVDTEPDEWMDNMGTTVMMRNIPNKYSRDMLVERLRGDFHGHFDFVYLPMDFKNECNMGYAFINFRSIESCHAFVERYNGVGVQDCLPGIASQKVVEITPARVMGLENNVRRLQTSHVMQVLMKYPDWMPLIFDKDGEILPFPECVKPNVPIRTWNGSKSSDAEWPPLSEKKWPAKGFGRKSHK